MSQINDIINKAKQGNFESMEYILKTFKPKVTAICREYFLLGAEFDDLSQEGMIGLYKAVMAYNSEKNDNFSNFATMCIHHQIQNAVKVASSKKNQPLNEYLSISAEGSFSENNNSPKIMLQGSEKCIEQISLDKEHEMDLYEELKELLTDEQYSILLMYLNGYTYNQIAQEHNITSKKVDNNIQSIKKKLKVLLKGE